MYDSHQYILCAQYLFSTEHSEKEKLETDAMYKLDHGGKDKEKLRAAIPSLTELQEHQSGWKDDFQLNSALRRKFRVSYMLPISADVHP